MVADAVARTVDGPVSPTELGVVSIHEHLSCAMSYFPVPPRTERQRQFVGRPLSIEFLGDVRRDPVVFADVLGLDDVDLVAAELRQFGEVGGGTVVEVTSRGIHPDPEAVRAVSRKAGVKVVLGCGHYLAASHAPDVALRSVDELAEELVAEIRDGIGTTGIRPGVIGEIGTGAPVEPAEWKTLEAACIAQRETGLPIFVHIDPTGPVLSVLERVLEHGVAPARINLCHMDCRADVDELRRVAEHGVFLSLDTFGMEVYYDSFEYAASRHDAERVQTLLDLLELGVEDQLLLGQDVCMKLQLTAFGGYGYGHVLRHIVPQLLFLGVPHDTIDRMLIANPQRLLAVSADRTVEA